MERRAIGSDTFEKINGLLFCTDPDSTLYNDNLTVWKENVDAIEYFQSKGGLFTFITGRVRKTATYIYQTIKPNAPYGCINGCGIYDGDNDAYLWMVELPRTVLELVRAVDEQMPDMGIQFNTANGIWFCKDSVFTPTRPSPRISPS